MPNSRGSSDARHVSLSRPDSESESSSSEDDDEQSDLEAQKHRVPLWFALLGMAAAALVSSGATIALSSGSRGAPWASTGLGTTQDANALDDESERGSCVPGTHTFQEISTFDPWAQNAVYEAFRLVNHARKRCPQGGLPSLPFGKAAFLMGQDHCHTVKVQQKYSRSCGSETYNLDFRIVCHAEGSGPGAVQGSNGTSFIVQVNRDLHTQAWVLLQSRPQVCDVTSGSAASPRTMPIDSNETMAVADFAAFELGYAMQQKGCLPAGSEGFNVSRVLRATAVVVDGVAWRLSLELEGGDGAAPRAVELTVLERCAEGTACIRQLSVPGGDVCKVLEASTEEGRRLAGAERQEEALADGGGVHSANSAAVDPTNILDAHRQFLRRPRRLQANGRKPLTVRHIQGTSLPYSLDMAADDCYVHIPPFNQGHCASCYAAAAAQMIGIRKCLLDKKEGKRRLFSRSASLRSRFGHVASIRTLGSGSCQDDAKWKVFGKGRTFDCAWFAAHDAGCRKYPDHGQLSHCLATCGTCGVGGLARTREGAYYQYMPSLNDVATCSRDSEGTIRGCNGGGPEDIWNHWMMDSTRDLWIHGVKCMPNQLKCHEAPDGVTNPLTNGQPCKAFDQYPVWQRPCRCIARNQMPAVNKCSSRAPPAHCRHEVPPAFFIVKSVAHGLSPRDASENMQRHIQEYGPILVAVLVTNEFRQWDWSRRAVYTGGTETLGGHVMIAAGWGNYGGTDYWQIRNSWGEQWGNGGYCKFQRGINLDTIEERGVAASMPTADFHDFSEPVCDLKGIRWQWWMLGDGTVTNYTGFVDFACDKDCSLDVHFSERSADPDHADEGGVQLQQSAVGGGTTTFRLNLLTLGFGTEAGAMYVGMQARDATGNSAETHTSLRIPPAGS